MRDLNPRPTLSIMDPWGVRRRALVTVPRCEDSRVGLTMKGSMGRHRLDVRVN